MCFSIVICRNYSRAFILHRRYPFTIIISLHPLTLEPAHLSLVLSEDPEMTMNLWPVTNHLKTIRKHSDLTSGLFNSQHTHWNTDHHMCGNVCLCSSPVIRIKMLAASISANHWHNYICTCHQLHTISTFQEHISHSHYMFMTWLSHPEVEKGVGTAAKDSISIFVSEKPVDIFKETLKSPVFVVPK